MKILIIGGGGREHAMAWKIKQSPLRPELFCSPGNPGIAGLATLLPLPLKPPFAEVIEACRREGIDLVAVGPEDPLAAGIADALMAAGIEVFGPSAAGARLEASKQFAKEVMLAAGIPTGRSAAFTEVAPALAFLDGFTAPYVVKADGLAAGKGVTVAATREEAESAIRAALEGNAFGAAGRTVLIEEYLAGVEASLLAFADGNTILAMDSAQDHKPVFDGDKGPNTGGMGTISPAPVLTPELRERAIREILEPLMAELRRRGIDYRGIVYAGLMITKEGPKVIEFNCRFGDPETQVLLPRLENDLVEVMLACARGRLGELNLRWTSRTCVCVVAASGGYPGDYAKGKAIEGLETPAGGPDEAVILHAGTALDPAGRVVTSGGRVLGVSALGATAAEARERAYARLAGIGFEGMHFRRDIGLRAGG